MALSRRARAALLLALGSALSACGNGGDAAAPDPMTQNEAEAVADAAEMLEERIPADAGADAETIESDSIE